MQLINMAVTTQIVFMILSSLSTLMAQGEVPVWSSSDRPPNMPEILLLDVMCYTDKMTVTIQFSVPFQGMIFSKGSYGQQNCVYVSPNSGRTDYKFDILYDQCGTKPDLQGKFYENTIVIQYEKDLIELWDEAKRLRCEWANDYRQMTESMPAVKIDDLTVIELNFQGDNVDCWMEIQEGKGPWAGHVSGIVPIGSTLTLVVAISDPSGEFDMMVRSCVAHDGIKPPLQLTDERGCVMRPKMFSNFMKAKTKDGRASVITYAHFSAFKFPDTMQVNIQCKVVICRHGCPKPCSMETVEELSEISANRIGSTNDPSSNRRTDQILEEVNSKTKPSSTARKGGTLDSESTREQGETHSYFPSNQELNDRVPSKPQGFPYGPRSYNAGRSGRKVRNAADDKELRVAFSYQAISRTDLAFAPNTSSDTVSIYAGRRSQDTIGPYGVCLSVPSFGALFASLGMFAVTAVLVAAVCGFHYRNYSIKMDKSKQLTCNGDDASNKVIFPVPRTVMQMNTIRTKIH